VSARRATDVRRPTLAALPVLALALADPDTDARPRVGPIDVARSTVQVEVSPSGLLSPLGHDHRISAPIASGTVQSEGGPRVELVFDARALRVADANLSDADRERVQTTMEGAEVLDAARYPEIDFRSGAIEAAGAGRWSVAGTLTLHGETRPVKGEVVLAGGRYRGSAAFRLSDFGIRPPVAGAGTVRVRDAVRIVFDVAVAEAPP
jgi:polyisoprenoid-binding protein YceI